MTLTSLITRSPDDTAALAARIAARLTAGDTLLLQGEIGAGKTHFARAIIRNLLPTPEDIPSPTFTLVQTYFSRDGTEIWHSDLYRLSDVSEVDELGLTAAFDTAICLIEWPDRLGEAVPESSLLISFELGPDDESRKITMTAHSPAGQTLLARLSDG
jgi:tRNA threonylcarbamoyladenosine biosynthesis protein TsaE